MFEDDKNKIKSIINNAIDEISDATVNKLIGESPVWTGAFVKQMKVEETAKSYPRDAVMVKGFYPPKVNSESVKEPVRIRLKSDLKHVLKKNGYASINNTAGHAMYVEYLGWVSTSVGKSPQMPFAKTKESIRLIKKMVLSGAKHRAFIK